MASSRQIAANRRNAQKSTGPRTPAGRHAVRFNALRHGLRAAHNVMALEDRADFTRLLDALYREHRPSGYTETSLVEQMAVSLWRLRRARRLETAAFNYRLVRYELPDMYGESSEHHLAYALEGGSGLDPFGNLSRYEALHQRAFYRALREFRLLRNAAAAPQEPSPRSHAPAPKPVSAAPPASAPASNPAARGQILAKPIFTEQSQFQTGTPAALDNAHPPFYSVHTVAGGFCARSSPPLLPVWACMAHSP